MLTLSTGLLLSVGKGAPIPVLYFYISTLTFCVVLAVFVYNARIRRELSEVRQRLSDLQPDNSQLCESIELDELTCVPSRRYLH